MTGLASKNQKLLAYANHMKGHSHWQCLASFMIVGDLRWLETKIWANFMQMHSDY